MQRTISEKIQENYTVESMGDKVRQALEKAGLGNGPLQWSDLVPFDQFHVRGLEASRELAEDLRLKKGQAVLDVGSGLGGPARYLAAVHKVHVTGLDLTPQFIQISNYLSHRAGLAEELNFKQGEATELPFPDEVFDVAWTQHVAMNIQDKEKLYKGIHRVLKPNGRLAIYDPIKGNHQPIVYPTPWAREEAISFVSTEGELKEVLNASGFEIHSFDEKTDIAADWFQRQREQQQAQQSPNPLSLPMILGPELGPAIANFARNVVEGRVRLVQIIAIKS